MKQNHMLDFRIISDMSSMNLTGYIQFLLIVAVNGSAYGKIVEQMYRHTSVYYVQMTRKLLSKTLPSKFRKLFGEINHLF